MLNPKLTTRLDDRWPHGAIGRRRATIVAKNARLYLATPDGQVAKVGFGDVGLEAWHRLEAIAEDGLLLVCHSSTYGTRLAWYYEPEAEDATFEDLIPGLALALDPTNAVLLNFPTSGRHTLGAIHLDALDRDATRTWLARRLAALLD